MAYYPETQVLLLLRGAGGAWGALVGVAAGVVGVVSYNIKQDLY